MGYDEFAAAEKSGWSQDTRARAYVDLFAPVSDQLIAPLVSGAEAAPGRNVLDLCCGHGNAAKKLVEAGATVTGLDFSSAMLERARPNVPTATFVEGDAARMPFEDDSFDAVVCNVGFGHLPDPNAVLHEIARVLRPGGVAAMTSWREPGSGWPQRPAFHAQDRHRPPPASVRNPPHCQILCLRVPIV